MPLPWHVGNSYLVCIIPYKYWSGVECRTHHIYKKWLRHLFSEKRWLMRELRNLKKVKRLLLCYCIWLASVYYLNIYHIFLNDSFAMGIFHTQFVLGVTRSVSNVGSISNPCDGVSAISRIFNAAGIVKFPSLWIHIPLAPTELVFVILIS